VEKKSVKILSLVVCVGFTNPANVVAGVQRERERERLSLSIGSI
jgi:hypothetical protein